MSNKENFLDLKINESTNIWLGNIGEVVGTLGIHSGRPKFDFTQAVVKTCESWIPPSPNLDKVTESFDKYNNTDLFLPIHGVYVAMIYIAILNVQGS